MCDLKRFCGHDVYFLFVGIGVVMCFVRGAWVFESTIFGVFCVCVCVILKDLRCCVCVSSFNIEIFVWGDNAFFYIKKKEEQIQREVNTLVNSH